MRPTRSRGFENCLRGVEDLGRAPDEDVERILVSERAERAIPLVLEHHAELRTSTRRRRRARADVACLILLPRRLILR